MKRRMYALLLVLVAALAGITASTNPGDELRVASEDSPLPLALDSLFPPHAPGPVYLLEMIKLAGPFSGIVTDLYEGDLENARRNFEMFQSEYAKNSRLVPEWSEYYSEQAVADLGAALTTKDPAKIMPAYARVGATCCNCHDQNMTRVYFKYHWGDFGSISETDPVTNEEVSHARLMQLVESDLNGIMNDLMQGQAENALSHVVQLEQRYEAMAKTCYVCHDTERRYYVDREILDKFGSLKGELSQPSVNAETVGHMVQSIGMESCFKCHLVHVPASMSK